MLAFLYCAIVWPHLDYAMEANARTLRADTNQLGRVQRLATRLVRGLRHVPYEERHRQLNLFSLVCLRADLTLAFKIVKGEVDQPSDFVLRSPQIGVRGHICRLLQGESRLRHRTSAFFVRVVKCWNRLPTSVVLSPSVSISKKHLERQWSEIFPASPLLKFCSPSSTGLCFPYPQILICLCCYCGPSWPILPSINKI